MITNIRGFYEANGVDYDFFLRRMMGKETLLYKYLTIFLSDNTYSELSEAVQAKDYDAVLDKAHTLKGVTANIGLNELSRLATEIVSSVRCQQREDIAPLFEELQSEYERIISALNS